MLPLHRKQLISLFFLAFVLRLALFGLQYYHAGSMQSSFAGDSQAYLQLARNVFSGNGFSESTSPPFLPVAGRMPLVPLLLGLFRGSLLLYLVLQIAVASFSVLLVYYIGRRTFSESVGFWGAILLACDPLSIYHSSQLMTETYFTFFLLLAVYFFVEFRDSGRLSSAAFSGLGIGLASLARPIGPVEAILIVFGFFFSMRVRWRERIAGALICLSLFCAVIAPWLIRNYLTFGAWSLSSLPSYNLYWYNAREFYAKQNHLSSEDAKILFRQWANDAQAAPANELVMARWYKRKGMEIIVPQWAPYLRFHIINAGAVFLNTGISDILRSFQKSANDCGTVRYGRAGGQALLSHPSFQARWRLPTYKICFLQKD